MSKTIFRADINGLRAIAVISVVLFHFGVAGFSGGFVGVDVFFVISGFLMTGIILKGINKDSFNFRSFYLARARRIVPALFFLTLFLLGFGWFYLSPSDYSGLAKEVDRALLFLSNNYYYKNSGYFDPGSHERFLLHTWSLSVEWQFYILYPILLFGFYKISKNLLPLFIIILFFSSFLFSFFKSNIDQSYAFYMLVSRAWEMLLGGIVYYAVAQQRYEFNRIYCHYLGLFFIALSILMYSPATIWPGVAALLPAVGTALIIYANKDSFFTSNWVFQKLGDWSYSIYLWHWPLVVFVLLFDIEKSFFNISLLILLSVLLGALSYYCIENPARRYLVSKSILISFGLVFFSVIFVLGAAKIIRNHDGVVSRLPKDVFLIFNEINNVFHEMGECQRKRDKSDCLYGEGELGVIVIGDSHARSIMGSVTSLLEGQRVLDWTLSACPTIKGAKSTGKAKSSCSDFLSPRLDGLSKYAGVPILVSNRFSLYFMGSNEKGSSSEGPSTYLKNPYVDYSNDYVGEIYGGYLDTICKLSKNNPVYILKPIPELKINVLNTMGQSMLVEGEAKRVYIELSEYKKRNQVAIRLLDEISSKCNATLLDPTPYLCDGGRCYGDVDGLPVYFDDDHLNMRGSDLLKPLFEKALLNK